MDKKTYVLKNMPFYRTHSSGLITSANDNQDNLDWALQYTPDDEDIFICTYPKCGTTWTSNILYLMKHRGQPLDDGQRIEDNVPFLECAGKYVVEAASKPRLIKTHLPYHLVPKNPKSKYVYVARNPKDCCVSFYHHTKMFVDAYRYADGDFDDFFELFMAGQVDYNDYFDHLLSWVAHKDDANVLFVLYEDMAADLEVSIEKMGSFLGGIFRESSEDRIIKSDILMHSRFKNMKNTQYVFSLFENFLRKGEVGDWKNYFSEKQVQKMDQKFSEKLSGTKAEHFWTKYDDKTRIPYN